jgi:hypothetical protein
VSNPIEEGLHVGCHLMLSVGDSGDNPGQLELFATRVYNGVPGTGQFGIQPQEFRVRLETVVIAGNPVEVVVMTLPGMTEPAEIGCDHTGPVEALWQQVPCEERPAPVDDRKVRNYVHNVVIQHADCSPQVESEACSS